MTNERDDLIGHPLAAVRAQRGWTLGDVAELVRRRSGLNMACRREKVWRWERSVTPELPAQLALAAELGVSADVVEATPWPAWLLLVDQSEQTSGPWTARAAAEVLGLVVG